MSIVQSDWTGRLAKHAALFFPSKQKLADPSGQWDPLGGIGVCCLTYLALPSGFPDSSVNRAQAAKPETAVDRSNAVPRRKNFR